MKIVKDKLRKSKWYDKPFVSVTGLNILMFSLNEELIQNVLNSVKCQNKNQNDKNKALNSCDLMSFILLTDHLELASNIMNNSKTKESIETLKMLFISSLGFNEFRKYEHLFFKLQDVSIPVILHDIKSIIRENLKNTMSNPLYGLRIELLLDLIELNDALDLIRDLYDKIGIGKLLADYLKVPIEDIVTTNLDLDYNQHEAAYYEFVPNKSDNGLTGRLTEITIALSHSSIHFSTNNRLYRASRTITKGFGIKHRELYPEHYL